MFKPRHRHGFTLVELLVTMAIVGIVTTIALPSYRSYVDRSRIPVGLDALAGFSARMEQLYQDNGNYGATGCGVTVPTAANYTVSCTLGGAGQTYVASAVGNGPLAGYTYTIDSSGNRATTANPHGVPSSACWSIKGTTCDT
jgi:type IV pilus assembly protein PilE